MEELEGRGKGESRRRDFKAATDPSQKCVLRLNKCFILNFANLKQNCFFKTFSYAAFDSSWLNLIIGTEGFF